MPHRPLSAALLTLGLLAAGCGHGDVSPLAQVDPFDLAAGHADASVGRQRATDTASVPTAPPPFSPGIFPCSQCHEGGPTPAAPLLTLNHAAHLERGLECVDCHDTDDDGVPGPADSEFCGECHDPAEIAGNVKAYFDSVTSKDGKIAFPSRWKTRDVDARHEKHGAADVECAACHGAPGAAAVAKPKPVTLMATCVDCHTEREKPAECKTCHTERLEPTHKDIVLHHAEEQRRRDNAAPCFGCHNMADRDTLQLANGAVVSFTESYRLCGQCHGPTLRDWRLGLHGKRMGYWRGEQEYRLCAHCHNPHDPEYPSMQALPPPTWPGSGEPSRGTHD